MQDKELLRPYEKEGKMRGLSKSFIDDLDKDSGILHSVLERVKNDSTLCLEIREGYISIYYRGGSIMKITEGRNGYTVEFDQKYCEGHECSIISALPDTGSAKDFIQKWVEAIPFLKQAMDFWFSRCRDTAEREFKQLVLRENNGSTIGNSTDYFIIDIEYDNHEGACFDLVAVKWESEGTVRKLPKGYKPKLVFIEMKYGDGALDRGAGMEKHIQDFKDYLACGDALETTKKEMIGILKQKRRLGLIPALKENSNTIDKLSDEVDFIFLLANHDPASKRLKDVLDIIRAQSGTVNLGFGLKFCLSNFMGYGIYKENVYQLESFMERFSGQIWCNS